MKLFDLYHKGVLHKIQLEASFYEENGNLSIRMIEWEGGIPAGPWSVLTINLSVKCQKDRAYIDVYRNGNEILMFIAENRLAFPTGNIFAGYPEYQFDHEILKEIGMIGHVRTLYYNYNC